MVALPQIQMAMEVQAVVLVAAILLFLLFIKNLTVAVRFLAEAVEVLVDPVV